MIKIRNSNLMKAISLFMAFSIFTVSCQDGLNSSLDYKNNCNQLILNEGMFNANLVQKLFNFSETLHESEGYDKLSDFSTTVFGDNNREAELYFEKFETESDRYKNEGFVEYVNHTDKFSNELASQLITFSENSEEFILSELPTLEEYQIFIKESKNQIIESSLCHEEKNIATSFLTMNLGFAQYIYQNYYSSEYSNYDVLSVRDGCDNFWKKLLCGTLGTIVGIGTTYAIVELIALLGPFSIAVFYAAGTVLPDGSIAQVDTVLGTDDFFGEHPEAAVLLGAILGIYAGVSMYKWCCSWFDQDDDQICEAPDGSYYIESDCNEFTYNVFGPSTYTTTIWDNDNTDPSSLTTTSPRLELQVPNYGEESIMQANITCLQNSSNLHIYLWQENLTFISELDLFPLSWTTAPPPSFTYQDNGNIPDGDDGFDNSIYVALNTPNNNIMSYNWNVSSPHSIIAGGGINDNFATIEISSPNVNLTTSVTVTNNCLNETDMISAFTVIQ